MAASRGTRADEGRGRIGEQNVGPTEATRFVMNVQPVMPFALNKDWNLIMRVVPFVSQPALGQGGAPARGGLIWGAGPVISLPSTTVPTHH